MPRSFFVMAAGLGFEPRQTDSESVVLPLDDPANYLLKLILSDIEAKLYLFAIIPIC